MWTTGRARTIACLVLVTVLFSLLASTIPVAAPPPIPMRTDGRAFDRSASALPPSTPIRTFVDGVGYSNASAVRDGIGSFSVLTVGNSKTNMNGSDTPTIQEGANRGDRVIFAAGDFIGHTDVFQETIPWYPGAVVAQNLMLGSNATTPEAVKIQGVVTRPAQGGNQFVLVCNPAAAPVSLFDYYLETDAPSSYHGKVFALTGALASLAILRVNLTSTTWLTPSGDALKLVYRNPKGASASAAGLDIVVDRVEFNATSGGSLNWEPGNTIMGDAPAPGIGRILRRDVNCTDTNRPTDFSLGIEPGLPPNGPPTVSISAPSSGQRVQAASPFTFTWTMSDDVFLASYLRVWANVTIGNQTTVLLADVAGTTSVVWNAPDVAIGDVAFRVDVADPFGAHASAVQTFSLTRESPIALYVAILIAVVLAAFLVFGLLRARKREEMPPPTAPPQPPPTAPVAPPVSPAIIPGSESAKKICPRCHTAVRAIDTSCFFCGYKFSGDTGPLP